MNKSYTLDTNALLERENTLEVLRNGEENTINIPIPVINELDGLQKNKEKSHLVRKVIENIWKNRESINFTGDINQIVNNDDRILKATNEGDIFVTNDLVLQLKAFICGITSEEFRDSIPFESESEKYTGFIDVYSDEEYINNCFYFKEGKLFFWNNGKERCIDYDHNVWKVEPRDVYQNAAFELLLNRNIPLTTLQSRAGTGKAQPLYSKILTPIGWKKMANIKEGDIVYDKNGKKTKVLKTFPQGVKDIYEVNFNDKTSTRCCNEHLWEISYYNNKSWKVKELKDLKDDLYVENRKRYKWFIPYNDIVDFDDKDVKIDPYLMGCLIGDGGFTADNISFSNKDEFIIEKVNKILNEEYNMKLSHTKNYGYLLTMNNYKNSGKKGIISNPIKKYINDYDLLKHKSEDKFIPKDYLFNSKEKRIELLKGLMDTDGGMNRNYCCFYTSSEKLKDDVTFLCRSLGFKVQCLTKLNTKYNYNDETKVGLTSYTLCLSHNQINPFKIKRKRKLFDSTNRYPPSKCIKSVEYIGKEECKCIMVESETKTYLTDDFIVTHNSFIALASALYMTFQKKLYDKIVVVKPNTESGNEMGFLPGDISEKMWPHWNSLYKLILKLHDSRPCNKLWLDPDQQLPQPNPKFLEFLPINFLRGDNINHGYVVVSEAQNFSRNDMRTLLTRMGENCKVVVEGDTSQVDNPVCNSENNGLNWIVRLMKGDKKYAHLKLNCKRTRGEVCDMVTEYGL